MSVRAGAITSMLNQPSAQIINGSVNFVGTNYLTRTPGSAGNRKTWTFSAWVKRWNSVNDANSYSTIFGANSDGMELMISNTGVLNFYDYSGGGYQARLVTTRVLRDPTAWFHVVAVADTTNALSSRRWRLYINGTRVTDFSTEIYPSINYDSGVNSTGLHVLGRYGTGGDTVRKAEIYLSNAYVIDGLALGPEYFGFYDPRTRGWRPKKFDAKNTTVNDGRVFSSSGTFTNWDDDGSYPKTELFDGTLYTGGTPNGASSDSSSEATFDLGNHRITGFQNLKINIFISSNQLTASNIVSVNGIDITQDCHNQGNDTWTIVDLGSKFTSLQSFRIANNNIYVGGFIVDGVIMKDSTTENLAFGTNGFYLPLENQSDFEKDKSGRNNNFSKNGFTGTVSNPDIVKDSPSGAASGGPPTSGITTTSSAPANYCTLNPLDKDSNISLENGNLDGSASGGDGNYRGTIPMKTGKFYWEITQVSGGNYSIYGIIRSTLPVATLNTDAITYRNDGFTKKDGVDGSTFNSISGDEVLGVACDCDNNQISYYKNNSLQTTITFTTEMADDGVYAYGRWNNGKSADYNFGQKPFKYAPPEGFLPINSATVRPETVITNPDQYVGVTTYRGDTSSVVVKDLSFKPDLVWVKGYTDADRHGLYDTVRGVTKRLQSPHNNAEDTQNGVTSFNDNGFSIGNYADSNGNGRGYVAWCWKAGGNKNTYNVDDVGYASAGDIDMGVGDLNSVSYDKSQTWTSQISGTENGSYPFANMFNGDNEATHAYPANGTTATFTPSPSFSNAKTVKVWYYAPTINSNTFQLNGVNVGDQMTETSGTLTKTFNVDGFTSWAWSKGVGGDDSGMLRIDVDGVQLVDNGVSTSDVPSIAPSGCSVGTKQGFSIIKFASGSSGTKTLPHGLSESPAFILLKTTGATSDWSVYHKDLGATDKYLVLNTTAARASAGSIWGAGAFPFQTSRVFGIKSGTTCATDQDVIAYCWHDVPGLQKFGTYSGLGGTATGSFVELGFRPAIVWVKDMGNGNSNSHWCIFDSRRPGSNTNPAQNRLHADADSQQDPDRVDEGNGIHIESNGFKVRSNNWYETNLSGGTYIYCAWAEAPSFNLFGGQSNAR